MTSPDVRIVLVRHGETEWSRDHKHTGRTDVPLTGKGERDAEALGKVLEGQRFAHVLSSPRQRAVATCRLAGLGDPEVVDDLHEWDYGVYEGRTTADIRAEVPGWTVWTHPSPEGETAIQVGARADRVVERLRRLTGGADGRGDGDQGGDVAVFSHGHFLRVLGARWVGLDVSDGQRLGLMTAAVCQLGYERETPVLWLWNETRHL
jgi:broad specificity phosphatase PhoE